MKLNILFLISKSKLNKKGKCPIKCRLTLNKTRHHFATGQFINPEHWNSKQQLVKPPEPDSEYINSQLSLIKTKINRAFLLLQVKEESFTVTDVYKNFKGEKTAKEYNTVEFFEHYLKKLKKLVGIDIEIETWRKFEHVKKDIQSFIKWQYKTADYPLKDHKQIYLYKICPIEDFRKEVLISFRNLEP